MHTHIKMKVKPLHANSHQTKSYKGKTKSNSIISFRQGSNRNQNMLMALNLKELVVAKDGPQGDNISNLP